MKKLIICSLLLLTACGGISQITPDIEKQTESKLPAIDSTGGQLCLFRVANFVSMGSSCEIFANEEYIGRLPNSSYFCANLSPDEYTITAKCFGGGRMGAETTIRAGQRKYIELSAANISLTSQTREIGLAGIYGTM
jgi:hypothetical protein